MKKIVLLYALFLSTSSVHATSEDGGAQEIALLRQQLDVLSKRLQALESKQYQQDRMIHGLKQPGHTASQNLPTPSNASASTSATTDTTNKLETHLKKPHVLSGNDKVSLTIGGHINRAVLYASNGNQSRTMHVDNDNSASRLRVEGNAKITPDLKAIATVEAGISSNSSADLDIGNSNALTSSNNLFAIRRVEVAFDHAKMGKLWIGRGQTASDDTSECDLSGTYVITSGASAHEIAGGVAFRDNNNNAVRTISQVITGMDGLSRQDRIRYDTPQFYGFSAGFSHMNQDSHDAALKYSGILNDVKIDAAAAYAKPFNDASHKQQYNGSISILFPNGFNITVAGGIRKAKGGNRKDPVMTYVKLGYQFKVFSPGLTCFAVDTGQVRSIVTNSGVANHYGFYLVQNVDIAATELYLGFRKYTYSEDLGVPPAAPVSGMKDVNAIMAGARIKL